MIEKIQALCRTLERMEGLYLRALTLLEQEKISLSQLNFESLYAELREKDEILTLLRRLDKERLRIQDHFAMAAGKASSEVTLKTLAEMLLESDVESREMGRHLLRLRDRILQIVGALKHRVGLNKTFIESSMENLRGLAEALGQGVSRRSPNSPRSSKTYTGKAKVQENLSTSGNLLEKRL